MNEKNRVFIFHLLMMLTVFLGCHRPIMKENQRVPFESIRYWGGNNQRTGYSREDLSPRLEHRWTYKANSAIGRTILASDQYLFFGCKDGRIIVLDIRSGKSVRNLGTRKRIEATCLLDPRHLIIVQRIPGPSLKCVDLLTGKTRWKRDAGPIDGEPLLVQDTLIVVNVPGNVMAIGSKNGETIWKKTIREPVYNSPTLRKNTLILATDNGNVYSIDIRNGAVRWMARLQENITATPVLDKHRILVGTTQEHFFALSQRNGSVLWKFETVGSVYETAAVAENRVYLGTSQGRFYCLDTEDGTEYWQLDTESVIGTSPLVTETHVLFGTMDRTMLMADRLTGKIVWRFKARGRLRTTPLIWNGILVFASEDRYVYGFGEENQQ